MAIVIGDSHKHFGLYHLKILSPEFIFRKMGGQRFNAFGGKYQVKINSKRFQLFKEKGLACVNCMEEATIASIDAHVENGQIIQPHFNFYGIYGNGQVFMMTIDHIKPISKGGKNVVENLQPMCNRCNEAKKDGSPFKVITDLKSHIGKKCHIETYKISRTFVYQGTTDNKHILKNQYGRYIITTNRLLRTRK